MRHDVGRRVAFIVDHPRRDLAGVVLTAFELCQRGAICHLVPLNLQDREIWSLAPDLVVLNYLRRGNEALGRQLLNAGIGVMSLDTEGGVWPDFAAYAELLWRDPAMLSRVRCACMWGPRMVEAMVEHRILAREQMAVTGCPRFDFYHPRWQGVLGAPDGRPAPRILINTNFSISNPRFATVEENVSHLRRSVGWSQERLDQYLAAERAAVEAIIKLARDLERDYPLAEIIVRPHPFESLERYRDALRGISRITVDNAGPVQPEIYGSVAVIQRSCSTAIEAGLAGVAALSPLWVPAPWVIEAAESVSEPCESYAELRAKLDAIMNDTYQRPARIDAAIQRAVADWFFQSDGQSHERVSHAVARWLRGARQVDERLCQRHLCGLDGSTQFGPRRIAAELRFALRLSPDWSFRHLRRQPDVKWPETPKYFGVDEVQALASRIAAIVAAQGRSLIPVSVGAARDNGDYLRPHHGYSVTLRPAAGHEAA
jgi:surface carbohydrate biosynthesis protein